MTHPSSPPPTAYDPPLPRPSSPSSLPSPPTSPPPASYSNQHRSQSYDRPLLRRSKPSILDELLPTPTTSSFQSGQTPTDPLSHVIRRAGSVAVIAIFLLSITFMASTSSSTGVLSKGAASGLREVFGVGSQADVGNWIGEIASASGQQDETSDDQGGSDTDSESEPTDQVRPDVDFDHYKMLRTIPPGTIDVSSAGQRLIFIGDIHGSYDPLIRLMDQISYTPSTDRLIHVGDLIAKGSKNNEVLEWMRERRILGVRGNHDQAVIQWRGWMEWAGGEDWQAYVDSLSFDDEKAVRKELKKHGKEFPGGWEWKGQHWEIARALPKNLYMYLLDLPLVLHLPSLHSIVVHAGLLPINPNDSPSAPAQPLVQFSNLTSDLDQESIRNSEEISILFDVPQNQVPWNLLNMRGVYMKGKKKAKVTKSGKKGTPWSDVWKKEMKRCRGAGRWFVDGMGEMGAEKVSQVDEGIEELDEEKRQKPGSPGSSAQSEEGDLGCSPVTVIYGHAAGRGLDIKPFSKGIDTGCVYGRQLTILVLGDLKGLKGESVRVGDHQGILVSVQCGEGGI
ncbi:hypothetical protein I302_100617 [Kwoniella bestiolae CBS 10118]|uniref:Calcineurin-like phosphoesterase domain-containing protein n=1 Tax=Kwoniella bestiolae CBS 10118 TaxID=1296100 RepID=A0A1B9G5N3_9TREE|nr:hypothetical protein I302_03991 [Kwoniella bestiolae CBS 10118]OCF26308.1 hypothetical protein I302_03991 [Kwoniella bestiolae CBS 10118]